VFGSVAGLAECCEVFDLGVVPRLAVGEVVNLHVELGSAFGAAVVVAL